MLNHDMVLLETANCEHLSHHGKGGRTARAVRASRLPTAAAVGPGAFRAVRAYGHLGRSAIGDVGGARGPWGETWPIGMRANPLRTHSLLHDK